MEHFALGIAHVALQLGEQCHGCCHGHVLKHVFLPVLAHCLGVLGQFGGQVVCNDFLLVFVGNHSEDPFAEGVYGIEELLALARARREHHLTCRLKVFLAVDVVDVAIGSIGLAHDFNLQFLCEVIQGVAHPLHLGGFLEPLAHLLRIALHLSLEVAVYVLVLQYRIVGCALQALVDDGEAVEHLR